MSNVNAFFKYLETVYDGMESIFPGNPSKEIVLKRLKALSAKDLTQYVKDLETAKEYLPYFIPNEFKQNVDVRKFIKLAESLGFKIFDQLREVDPTTKQQYLTKVKYWVALLPNRLHVHYLEAKKSLPKDNKIRDIISGQVTNDSKGSSLSKSQLSGIISRDCMQTAVEFAKPRGGDIAAGRELNQQLATTGGASLKSVIKTNSLPRVVRSTASYLTAAHFNHNLVNKNLDVE